MKELVRVCNSKVLIYTPHKLNPIGKSHRLKPISKDKRHYFNNHKCHFTKTWFIDALNKLNIKNFSIKVSQYRYLPHSYIPIVKLPAELKVLIRL